MTPIQVTKPVATIRTTRLALSLSVITAPAYLTWVDAKGFRDLLDRVHGHGVFTALVVSVLLDADVQRLGHFVSIYAAVDANTHEPACHRGYFFVGREFPHGGIYFLATLPAVGKSDMALRARQGSPFGRLYQVEARS